MSNNTDKHEGGRKYIAPENMDERREFHELMKNLDVTAFRDFIGKSVPALQEAGWLSESDEVLLHRMHEYRATCISLGEEFSLSRNFLRAERFKYDTMDNKPKCATCTWFRTIPEGEEKACMHLGSYQDDICCPGYSEAKT